MHLNKDRDQGSLFPFVFILPHINTTLQLCNWYFINLLPTLIKLLKHDLFCSTENVAPFICCVRRIYCYVFAEQIFYVLFLGVFFLWNAFINMLSLYKSTELYMIWGLYVIDKPVLSFATRNTCKTLVCSSVSRNVQNRTYFIL